MLEERKREDRRVCKWGRVLVPQQPGSDISTWVVKGKVWEQRINGVPDRWRSAAWWILIKRRGSASSQSDRPKAATKDSESLEGNIGWVQDSLGISEGLY